MKVLPPMAIKSGNIVISGDISKKQLPASVPVTFEIDTKKAGMGEIKVGIQNANGRACKPHISIVDGKYVVNFTPEELGNYR
jgi:hypothetical protein